MNTQEKARELMAKKIHHQHQEDDSLLSLTEQERHEHHSEDVEEKARELVTENRHHDLNLHDNMLARSEEELEEAHS